MLYDALCGNEARSFSDGNGSRCVVGIPRGMYKFALYSVQHGNVDEHPFFFLALAVVLSAMHCVSDQETDR